MNLIDTHSHLYGPEFDEDREEALARAAGAGVGRLLLQYPATAMHPAASPIAQLMTIWNTFMTMPKTAIGIAENSSCEKTASCALQMRSIVFVAAIAATRLICAR